ncbi:MAG: hypothetical protein JO060_12065 [Candidatus Eremiobacteraeota bacterium]|nr:hypothetical protein [Candidatus Eremiobacteraeota bacterium]
MSALVRLRFTGGLALMVAVSAPVSVHAAPLVRSGSSVPSSSGHLYVGSELGCGVQSYTLHAGVPASKPDFTYQACTPFTIAPDGMLVASVPETSKQVEHLRWYPLHSHRSVRELTLPAPYATSYLSVALDTNGYIYTLFYYSSSLAQGRLLSATRSSTSFPCATLGVMVFAPTALGPANYLTCFEAGLNPFPFSYQRGFAVSPEGDVYVPDFFQVVVYGNARTSPVFIRTLTGPGFTDTENAALDDADLFVMNVLAPDKHSNISEYDPLGNVIVHPRRRLEYPQPQTWCGRVAVGKHYLYVGGDNAVLVYDRNANGRTYPVATLNLPNVCPFDIATGP